MKGYGGFNNLRYKWQCLWRKRRRRGEQLLLVVLDEEGVTLSCWQDASLLWTRTSAMVAWQGGAETWWQELTETLRRELTFARLQEQVATLVLLRGALIGREELNMPLLSQGELVRALTWEAEQLLPQTDGKPVIAHRLLSAAGQEQQLELWFWPQEQMERLRALCAELRWRLEKVLVGTEADELPGLWYEGLPLPETALSMRRREWQLLATAAWLTRYSGRLCLLSLLLSVLIYVVAQGGVYLARQGVEKQEGELARYAVWEERLRSAQAMEARLKAYKRQEEELRRGATHSSAQLLTIGRAVDADAWLEQARYDAQGGTWTLEGGAYGSASLPRLLERLERGEIFKKVELVQSGESKQGISFNIRLAQGKQ